MEPQVKFDIGIQKTRNYSQFNTLVANRSLVVGHVNLLKQAFAENPTALASAPILVNEKKEVIDGQHRLQAALELDIPIYYIQVPGLRIDDARKINVSQRPWRVLDWANSYAASGNKNYQRFLKLLEDYNFVPSIILFYADGITHTGPAGEKIASFKNFRAGNFHMDEEQEAAAKERLDRLTTLRESIGFKIDKSIAQAFLTIMKSENFDMAHFVHKLRMYGDNIQRQASVHQYGIELDELYNHRTAYNNRVRVY